ncbi:MAG: glutamate--tRNA ligase [Desulfobacterales bacterium]|jgi:glutamyl-tRNA synthetase|nr:glutamate--tRNA ligase [Desulfobacterales bacterium]
MKKIITRFPPSPSGFLHLGGARTALFNWLYARHMKGEFVLRIEDTDAARSTDASVDAIFEALEWLGIEWDSGPFFQSKRTDIYLEYIQKLLDSGHAYYCTCLPEEVEAMREKAKAEGGKPKYDGTCRNKNLSKTDKAVVRFKAPELGTTILPDVIKGNIVFQNAELDDFIICRSDGSPTYNLAVVVDDITMGINTVIRGDDHVNNSPKQILLFKALGHPLPTFGHVPMVLGHDKTRLSKRHGATSVTAYRDEGILPDAMINYLVRLGWSHGDQEFFTRAELIEKFSIENIGRSAGVFNPEKLLALNADHIQAASPAALTPHLMPFLLEKGYDALPGEYLEGVIETLQPRSKTLKEMAEMAGFYYREITTYEEKGAQKFLNRAALEPMEHLIAKLEALDPFTHENLEAAFLSVMEATGLKLGKIAQPVRLALTGTTVSPGIFEIIAVLGKDRTLVRLKAARAFMASRPES